MKTKLIFATLFLLLNTIILSGRNLTSTNSGNDTLASTTTKIMLPVVEDENYINDIPFDTKAIALEFLSVNHGKSNSDASVTNSPLNIETITANNSKNILSIQPDEEGYIDDIPFNTSDVVEDYMLNGFGLASQPDNSKCGE